jgi:putative ABC transport system permease protein
MQRTASEIINLGAKVWVMDLSVTNARDNIPLPDYVLEVVKSIQGVKFAVPIYIGGGLARMQSGNYQAVMIIGLDDATLFGRPKMIEGNINAIYNSDAYILIKDADAFKLEDPNVGAVLEINDHRSIIVGTGKVSVGGLFGTPTLYTLYSRAIQDLPATRYNTSYILLEPKSDSVIPYIKQQVAKLGYMALTDEEFTSKNIKYYMYKTGFGTNILIMTLISFLVGLSIAGQTFYTFVLENIEKFGALKAIGAKKNMLIKMILFQAVVVGFLGFGFGVLLSSSLIGLAKLRLPDYASVITFGSLFFSFFCVLVIISIASYIGIRKVLTIEPFEIFRG